MAPLGRERNTDSDLRTMVGKLGCLRQVADSLDSCKNCVCFAMSILSLGVTRSLQGIGLRGLAQRRNRNHIFPIEPAASIHLIPCVSGMCAPGITSHNSLRVLVNPIQ